MVLIRKPVCRMQRGLPSRDRRRGWMWFCKICGFNTMVAQGVESFTKKQPECPCVEMEIGTRESEDRTEP